jgi:hypothetical protein
LVFPAASPYQGVFALVGVTYSIAVAKVLSLATVT